MKIKAKSYNLKEFVAYQGIYLTGSTSPAINDATVSVTGGEILIPLTSQTKEDGL